MQTFNRNKLALAVGSALLVMAGGAQAAAGAPALRATNPDLITNVSAGTVAARGLYDGTGYNGDLTVTLNFTAGVATVTSTAGYAQFGLLSPGADGFLVNNAAPSGSSSGNNPPGATDDVSITVLDASSNPMTLPVVTSNFNANNAGATDSSPVGSSAGSADITINPGAAPSAFRMSATGLLQWTADIASAAWQDVMLAVNTPANTGTARNGIITREVTATAPGAGATPLANTVLANSTAMAAVAAAASVHTAVAPDPIVGTHANAAGLVDGVIIDTLTPLTAAFTSANIGLSSVASLGGECAAVNKGGVTVPVTFGTAVNTTANASATAVAIANSTSGLSRYPIIFTSPTTVDWAIGNAAADAAAYAAACFNTGVSSTSHGPDSVLPVAVNTTAPLPTYSLIFSTAGTALTATLPGSPAVTDEATPVITNVAYTAPDNNTPPLSNLVLTFSEPMGRIGLNDGREIAQNVYIGADNLAALNLNDGTSISTFNGVSNNNGIGTLTISGILASDLVGKTVTVNKGISFKEPNDAGYSIATNYVDNTSRIANNHVVPSAGTYTHSIQLGGGIYSLSGADEAPSLVGQAATLASVSQIVVGSASLGGDTTARARTGADPTKIASVVVTFAAGKEIVLGAGKTMDQLATDLVLTVTDANNGVTQNYNFPPGNQSHDFQWHPTAADLAISAAGDTLTITLPTELIYANINPIYTVDVRYLPQGNTDGVLVAKADTTVKVIAGDVAAYLPLAALGGFNTNSTLYTQSISGYFAAAPALGSTITAYLAKWVDTPVMDAAYVTSIQSGKITNPGDKVATDLAIEFVDSTGDTQPGGYDVINAVDYELFKAVNLTTLKDIVKQAAKLGTVASKEVVATANQVLADLTAAAKADTTLAMKKQIPVYVKLIRSNDKAATGNTTNSQAYLNARAVMSTTADGAVRAFSATGGNSDNLDPVYQVMLDVTTGKITGRLTGQLVFGKTKNTMTQRGLWFVDSSGNLQSSANNAGPVADGLVTTSVNKAGGVATGTQNSFNLLLGVDPNPSNSNTPPYSGTMADNTLNLADTFVLAVLTENPTDATHYTRTLLTSANPAAANYVPFAANLLTMKGTRTTLSNTATGSFDVSKLKALPLAPSSNWALYGFGSPEVNKGADLWKAFDRNFVGLDTTSGFPMSFWTNDGNSGDAAIALLGNKAGVAVETGYQGGTTSTITGASVLKGSNALAWSNDQSGNWQGPNSAYSVATLTDSLFVQQAAASAVRVPAGWSLVTVPASGTLGAGVDAVIKVGAQADFVNYPSGPSTQNQFTWIKATDGTMPALTAGEAVFVYSKAGGAL